MNAVAQPAGGDTTAVRPFHVKVVPESELSDMRKRIQATKWPDKETVSDATQGIQLESIKAIAAYWASEYDWRKVEARLNALPTMSPRSMVWTSISFTSARSMRMRCRSL